MVMWPQCGNTDNLIITALVEVRVIQCEEDVFHEEGDYETEPIDAEHEFSDDSPMRCGACGNKGKVMDFDMED
jgi:hypothetical protein